MSLCLLGMEILARRNKMVVGEIEERIIFSLKRNVLNKKG